MKTIIRILLVLVIVFAVGPTVVRPPLNAICQGAYNYGPVAPIPMGSIGGASGG